MLEGEYIWWPWGWPPPRYRTKPPRAAHIDRLELHIHYPHKHRKHTMSTATLTWTNPVSRVDGVALAANEIVSVDIFDSGSSTPTVAIGNVPGPGTTFTTGLLSVGNHGFTVVINDSTGHVSAPSNIAAVSIAPTLAAPAAVTDLAAVVNK